MTKLWAKGYQLNQVVEDFMTGDDPQLDLRIARYDCIASIAHAKMLSSIGILNAVECKQLVTTLGEILELVDNGKFTIENSQEDVHTAIENYLVNALGDVGKKIHTARSRNDQVLTALRLYSKHELRTIMAKLIATMEVLHDFAVKYQNIPYVGRTHYQKAMPSSMGLWMGALLESLLDDATLIIDSYKLIDQSPLGSAASYGVSLPIDRQLCSDLLGFAKVQNNVLYANNSRGKFESVIIHALSQIMLDLSKLATDVILFSAPEMSYLNLPQEFCPGSSLMPNKKNPDPFELIRAKSATVMANLWQVMEISRALPSGYNRDLQETKRPLFDSLDTVGQTLEVVAIIMAQVSANEEKCLAGFSPEVFATDYALQLAVQGVPFRDAYGQVAANLQNSGLNDPVQNILAKTHLGATGNLGLDTIKNRIEELKQFKF
ncbi:MAG TPA: argininosuccinate lyase [Burkholderiales bacterium]|nr:argininosuccinate lyase [Burkholderiales bacterium]